MATSATTLPLPEARDRLLTLICQTAYQEGDFTLSSGQRSKYYINGKLVTLHPEGSVLVGRLFLAALPAGTVAVAGLTLGADPLVSALSVVAMYEGQAITPLIIRKEAKGHGTRAYIEGPSLPEGTAVVVLEDVVTTGQSAWKAVERLRQGGYQVDHILALVDRQQGGAAFYQAQGLTFQSLFTVAELQQHYGQVTDS